MYSGLAHVLLFRSTLEDAKDANVHSQELKAEPSWKRRSTLSRKDSVFVAYKPSHLEIEYGLLLEASARYWIKENKSRESQVLAAKRKSIIPNSGVTLLDMAAKEKKLNAPSTNVLVGKAWLHDRASLQIDTDFGIFQEIGLDMKQLSSNEHSLTKGVQPSTNKKKATHNYHPMRSSCIGICGEGHLPYEPIFQIALPKRISGHATNTNHLELVM